MFSIDLCHSPLLVALSIVYKPARTQSFFPEKDNSSDPDFLLQLSSSNKIWIVDVTHHVLAEGRKCFLAIYGFCVSFQDFKTI